MFGQILLVFFYLLVVVIMLNLLIAIMGNAYDGIAQNEGVEMERARAQAILYIERNILSSFMARWDNFFPRYLHVIQPHKGEENAVDESQSTAEGRIQQHVNAKMLRMETQMLNMQTVLDQHMRSMMTLLGAGMLVERKDHKHKLRQIQYKNWARTIPMWRCATCSTDYSSMDKMLIPLEPPVFVCNDYYQQLMMKDDDEEEWSPPVGCDFALCGKCKCGGERERERESVGYCFD